MKIHKTSVPLKRGPALLEVPVVHKMLDCQLQPTGEIFHDGTPMMTLVFWYQVELEHLDTKVDMPIAIIFTGDFDMPAPGTYFRTIQFDGLVYHIYI